MFTRNEVDPDHVDLVELEIVRLNNAPHLLVEMTYANKRRTEEYIPLDGQNLHFVEIPDALHVRN